MTDKEISELHTRAMTFAEKASVAQVNGEFVQADELLLQAYKFETRAARGLLWRYSAEPTRSILFRSAATLAMDCKKLDEAERLVNIGLSGHPPNEIAQELRDLYERLNFHRHLDLKGLTLSPHEMQMSIAGDYISVGVAPSDLFIFRIDLTKKLLIRFVERLMGIQYRESGPSAPIIRDYGLLISVPRASSFAVTLRVSEPKQIPLPLKELDYKHIESARIVDEVMSCFELYNQAEEKELRNRIPEQPYYRNFVGIARNLSPDGKDVTLVGFTTVNKGIERRVELTTPRNRVKIGVRSKEELIAEKASNLVSIIGRLKYADETVARPRIKLVDEEQRQHPLIVPEGMMTDIVRPLWGETVIATGYFKNNRFYLEDIRKSE